MYYDEQQVGLIWYYRTTPTGDWKEFSIARYQQKIKELQDELQLMVEDAAGVDL